MPGVLLGLIFATLFSLSTILDWNETGRIGVDAWDAIGEYHSSYKNKWEKQALHMYKRNRSLSEINRKICVHQCRRLAKKLDKAHEKFTMVYGRFEGGRENPYHVWIEYRGMILDPTLGRQPRKHYVKTGWNEIEYNGGYTEVGKTKTDIKSPVPTKMGKIKQDPKITPIINL